MKSLIKKVLLREFGETIDDYNLWLEMIYQWVDKPMLEYEGPETNYPVNKQKKQQIMAEIKKFNRMSVTQDIMPVRYDPARKST